MRVHIYLLTMITYLLPINLYSAESDLLPPPPSLGEYLSAQKLTFLSLADWQARPLRRDMTERAELATRNITNHTAMSFDSVKGLEDYHRTRRGWPAIGYHYLVRANGEVVQTRPLKYIGSHTKGHNGNSVGIALEGCFTEQERDDYPPTKLTEEMLTSYVHLCAYLHFRYHWVDFDRKTHAPRCEVDPKFPNSPR